MINRAIIIILVWCFVLFAELLLVNYLYLSGGSWCHFLTDYTFNKADSFLIFLGSSFITFLSTVLAQKQDERLKNSSFGALASGIITLVIAFLNKGGNNQAYLLNAFLGSAIGAFNGWLVYASIALAAFYIYGSILPFTQLITNGLDDMLDNIASFENSENTRVVKFYLEKLRMQSATRLPAFDKFPVTAIPDACKDLLRQLGKEREERLRTIALNILMSMVELFNLIYGSVNFRVSIIKFSYNKDSTGQIDKSSVDGIHWIYYSGSASPFMLSRHFKSDSMAFKLLNDEPGALQYVDMSKDGEKITDRQTLSRYQNFSMFVLNEHCVLTLDWGSNKKNGTISLSSVQTIDEAINNSLVGILNTITEMMMNIDGILKPIPEPE